MSNGLKAGIQNFMTKRCQKAYHSELEAQRNIYDIYVREQEEKLRAVYENRNCALSAKAIAKQRLPKVFQEREQFSEDILIVADENGILNPVAQKVILSFFEENPTCNLLYADEDVCIGEKNELESFRRNGVKGSNRCCPDLKPIPAPETFLSYQYFGNIWAIRRELFERIKPLETSDVHIMEYDLLLKAWELTGIEGVSHISEVLFHRFEPLRIHKESNQPFSREEMKRALGGEDIFVGAEKKFNDIKEAHGKRSHIAFTMETEGDFSYPVYRCGEPLKKISILIPSKDNPGVLRHCISSIYEKSTYGNFEVIVIDNGSDEENRKEIEKIREKYPFTYLYRPMEFNFSTMNNMAAAEATGEILLLLNDDMEVVTQDWLERMSGQLMQEGIGAVGAKLLYPNSTLIQHVGITNAVDGPVHKLLKKDDTCSYHRGKNKLVYNVIGVTGACLMVRKQDYEALGGLKEELRVAYNDVDLCFSLFEKGLRNVVRNDVILYHHESLSRGADIMSEEKMERLKWEREFLYKAHPALAYKDPYAGANNKGGEDFELQILPDYSRKRSAKELPRKSGKNYKAYPAGIHVKIDRVGREVYGALPEEAVYVITGFGLLPESDNSRYSFEMVFSGESAVYCMPIEKKLGPNMAAGFPKARNLELCGFLCWIKEAELPKGRYNIGIYAKDHCSRQRLFQETGETLTIE